MKRFFTIFVAIFLITGLAITAQAASTNYAVSEMDLSLDLPSEYLIFTRETEENDPLLAEIGISKADLMDYFAAESIYLDAIHPEGNEEIVVTMTDNEVNNFEELGDDALLALIPAMKEEYSYYGIAVSDCEIYHHAQVPFFRIHFNSADNSTYALQYYTIYDHKAMNFTLYSYTGPISEAQEIAMQNIVDTIFLNSYVPTEITPAFEYTDPNTGTTFTVPANWSAEETTVEDAMTAIALTHAKNPDLHILYTCVELPSFLKPLLKLDPSGDAVMEKMTSALLDSLTSRGYTVFSSSLQTYNDKTYVVAELSYENEVDGTIVSDTAVVATRLENDLMYMFYFFNDQGNPYFADFEHLLGTIEYGDLTVSGGSGLGIVIVIALVIIIAIPAIVLCIIFSAKKKKKKKAAAAASAQNYIYCHNCGSKLPSDSTFCHICGTRLTGKDS